MQVQSYLYFDGRCEEALEFYKRALGATDITVMRFKESPSPEMIPPGSENKVMHCNFRIGETQLMASDGRCEGKPRFEGISLTITVPTAEEAERLFAAVGEGGEVQMPMTETFYSPRFGMVADRFGVSWMILAQPTH